MIERLTSSPKIVWRAWLRDLVGTDRAQPRFDLAWCQALRGCVHPVQRFIRREARDLTEGIAARGQPFGRDL